MSAQKGPQEPRGRLTPGADTPRESTGRVGDVWRWFRARMRGMPLGYRRWREHVEWFDAQERADAEVSRQAREAFSKPLPEGVSLTLPSALTMRIQP